MYVFGFTLSVATCAHTVVPQLCVAAGQTGSIPNPIPNPNEYGAMPAVWYGARCCCVGLERPTEMSTISTTDCAMRDQMRMA